MAYKYEYNDGARDMYRWTCDRCGRSTVVPEGADVACCPCEFEEEV